MAKNVVATIEKGGALVSNAELEKQIAAQQKMLSRISTASKFISFKGGQIIINNKVVPGAKTEVILLAFLSERAYFPGDYDPDARQSPICYAYDEDGESDMAPHSEVKEAQAETCADCEFAKWGSASKGKGKACRESVRVTLLPNQADLSKAETWNARIPITSVSNFKVLVGDILGFGKPLHGVVVKLSVVPDAKTFFKIHWDIVKEVTPKDMSLLSSKANAAQAAIAFPYPNFEEDQKPSTPTKQLKTKARK